MNGPPLSADSLVSDDRDVPRPPRVVMVVANGITGDSRVIKTALSAAEAGWDVHLIGRATPRAPAGEERMGRVSIHRLEVRPVLSRNHRTPVTSLWRRMIRPFGYASREEMQAARAWANAINREAIDRRLSLPHVSFFAGLRIRLSLVFILLRRKVVGLRRRIRRLAVGGRTTYRKEAHKRRRTQDWRYLSPQLHDMERAYGPRIDMLDPDLIHAHDITMLGIAGRAAAVLTAKRAGEGRQATTWLYDSHEYVQGVRWRPADGPAYRGLEEEFICRADAVVTVSDELASVLQHRYELAATPTVLRNVPFSESRCRQDVRRECGVGPDVNLLVYSGWLAPDRGVGTVVRALPLVPDAHLGLVVGSRRDAHLLELLDLATELGVRDRVHVADYVPADQVVAFLSTATVGLCPFDETPNTSVSLASKFYEYMHARIPIVGSDLAVQGPALKNFGNGESFTPGDAVSCAEAISKVLADPREYVSRVSLRTLKKFSWEVQSRVLISLYTELTGLRPLPDTATPVRRAQVSEQRHLFKDPLRLSIGPANYAGQGWAWGRAVERWCEGVSVDVFAVTHPVLAFPADRPVTKQEFGQLRWQLAQQERLLIRTTHVLAEAGRPVFGTLNGDHISGDLPALENAGIRVGLLWHGSEVRSPSMHRSLYPRTPFDDLERDYLDLLQKIADDNLALSESFSGPQFVSTPDLLDFVPRAEWLPVVIDADLWAAPEPPFATRRLPVVLHVPSRANLKGTHGIDPILESMAERGLVDYQRAEGVPPSRMPELITSCDIVLDQFGVGSYGVMATQGMAAGRVVIGHVAPHVRERIGAHCPIVEAIPETIEDVLLGLISDPEWAASIGAASIKYFEDLHDGRLASTILATTLLVS